MWEPLDALRERRSIKWREHPPDVLPVWVAEMDVALAAPVRAALTAAVDRSDTGYAHPARLPEEFAAFAARRWGWQVEPARVSIVPDVMRGIAEVLRVVTAPGDGVVVNTPVYPPFSAHIRDLGRRVVASPLRIDDGAAALDLDRLEADYAAGARAHVLCSPHNPTGTVPTRDELAAVAELAHRYGVRVIADEVHAPLTAPGVEHVSYATVPGAGSSVTVTSASKAWNLAGLTCALLVAGPDAVHDVARIPPEVRYGTGLLGVLAGEAAFRDGEGWLDGLTAALAENRALLVELLARELPAVRHVPGRATYLAWLDCRALGLGDDPAATFLERGRVALSPGPTFGAEGAGFARFNLATSPALIEEAVRRMAAAL